MKLPVEQLQVDEISTKKRIAVLGGSFDPPTISHLQVQTHLTVIALILGRCRSD